MPQKEIVEYIEKELAKGFHISDIRRALLSVGHDVEIVEEAILHVSSKRDKAEKIRKIVIIAIPAIILAAVIISVFFIKQQSDDTGGVDELDLQARNESLDTDVKDPDQELFDAALASGDHAKCDDISNAQRKQVCLDVTSPPKPQNKSIQELDDEKAFDDALSSGDYAKCQSITSSERKQACLDVLTPSQETAQPQEMSDDEKNFNEALRTGERSHCDKIADSSRKQTCHDVIG